MKSFKLGFAAALIAASFAVAPAPAMASGSYGSLSAITVVLNDLLGEKNELLDLGDISLSKVHVVNVDDTLDFLTLTLLKTQVLLHKVDINVLKDVLSGNEFNILNDNDVKIPIDDVLVNHGAILDDVIAVDVDDVTDDVYILVSKYCK